MKINGLTLPSIVIHVTLILLLAGCSTNKAQKNPVKEAVICAASKCLPIAQQYSTEQLLSKFEKLIKENSTRKIPICSADAKTHACSSQKVCYFVLGGLLPGNGCADSLMFNDANRDKTTPQITMKTVMPLSFIGTNVTCDTAVTTLSINSENDIAIELQPYHCSWMVMGQMRAKFSFYIDRIDKDRGEISGYWNHSVAGTGNGNGSGYAILKFPTNISW